MKLNYPLRRIAVVLLLLGLVFLCSCAGSHDSRSATQKVRDNFHAFIIKDTLKKAGHEDKKYLIPVYTALINKQHNQAIILAEKLQSAHPNDEDLYFIRGIAYFEQNDLTTALRYFEKTISINNNRGDAYYYQSLMLYKLGQAKRALSSINTAIDNEKTAFQLMTQETLRHGGEWTVEGRRAHLFFLRATINDKLHKNDDSLSDINRAISTSPYKSAAYFELRGELYFFKSEYDRAYSDFQQVIELNPKDGDPWEMMGLIDSYMGRYDSAIMKLNKAVALEPDRLNEALGDAAVAYWLKGDRDSALETMGRALRKKPDYNAYYHLGYFHHLLGNHTQARTNFKRAEQLYPKIIKLWSWMVAQGLPKYAPPYAFYQQEYETAKKYLGAGDSVTATPNQSSLPTLEITSLNVVPDPVPVNTTFDIKISFKADIPGAGNKTVPVTFYFKIYKNQKKLFTSKNISIDLLNGRNKPWVQHMKPVPKAGVYKIVAFVKYKDILEQKSIPLTIE